MKQEDAVQRRVKELAGRIIAMEKELAAITAGQLDAVVVSDGEPPFLLASARQAMLESERLFRAIFDSVLDCTLLCDDTRRIVDVNPAGCKMLGIESHLLVGQTLNEVFDLGPSQVLEADWKQFIDSGRRSGEQQIRSADNRLIMTEYSAIANVVPGTHLIVMRDVTEERRTISARDQLNAELERRNRGLLALHGIGVKLGESLRLHDVYATIFREFTFHFLDSPHLALALFDKETQCFICDYAIVDGEPHDPSDFPPMPLGEGPTSRAFLERTSLVVDIEELEATLSSDRIVHIGDEAAPRSGIYVPLIVNNEAIGVLSVQHYERNAFRDVDMTLLAVMANHAAAAISNALLYKQTQQEITDRKRRERQLAAIASLSRELRTVQSQRAVLDTLLQQIQYLFQATGIAVALNPGSDASAVVVHAVGDYSSLLEREISNSLASDQAAVITGQERLAQLDLPNPEARTQNLCLVPLSVQNIHLGTILMGLENPIVDEDVALLASLADIAASTLQRARLYEQVQTQAQRLTRVMDTVPFGLLLLDREMHIVLANQPALHELGRLARAGISDRLESLAGVTLEEILSTPHGGVFGREITIDAEPAQVYDVLANPVEIDGMNDGWVLVLRDVTAEREMQNQLLRQDRLAAVGQLAAGIAHDFNNILAVIVLYVQMLQRSPNLKEAEQKRLQVVREQAQHASALVRQVLDFSRMSVMERGQVNLVDLVHTTMGLWERILPENIRLSFQVRPHDFAAENREFPSELTTGARELIDHFQYVLEGDAARLQQVLMNLALNARDAMPAGGDLRITLRRCIVDYDEESPVQDLHTGVWICLGVEDTGEGISSKHLPNIFDPFFTTKEIGKGTGLGLAQVYGIVRQHGGQVTVESRLGEGTRFEIYLPLAQPYSQDTLGFSDELPATEASGCILLVEDNHAAREATRAILEMHGYEVLEADNGMAALEVFRQEIDNVDLVLTDFVMPEMGGAGLYTEMVKLRQNLCVLFMTGYPLDDEGRSLLDLGSVDWLQKPFTIQELISKIARLLHD